MTGQNQGNEVPGDKNVIYSAVVGFVVRALMESPPIYSKVTSVLRGNDNIQRFVDTYIEAKEGDRILDIGCGTGYILNFLPDVDYYGFDLNGSYIKLAKKQFGRRGKFFHMAVDSRIAFDDKKFDIIIAMGVLHHLNDHDARQLFELASKHLKPTGCLVTGFDGCYVENQPAITRFILWLDRGKFIRGKSAYEDLARHAFTKVTSHIHEDLLNIPYTSIVLECRPGTGESR